MRPEAVCCRVGRRVVEHGEALYAGKPKGDWHQFKLQHVQHLDAWQKNIFATHPQAIEKSKLIGNFLELHELVMTDFLRAYEEADGARLDKAKGHFAEVVAKITRYASALGKPLDDATPAHCKGLKLP